MARCAPLFTTHLGNEISGILNFSINKKDARFYLFRRKAWEAVQMLIHLHIFSKDKGKESQA